MDSVLSKVMFQIQSGAPPALWFGPLDIDSALHWAVDSKSTAEQITSQI